MAGKWNYTQDTPEQIAACLSCKQRECINCFGFSAKKVHTKGKWQRMDEETKERILFLLQNDYSPKEISQIVGIQYGTIRAFCRRTVKSNTPHS